MAPTASPGPSKDTLSRRPEDDDVRPYIITQEIGKGSFATVYKGYHQNTHEAVAIKAVSRSILTTKLLENLKSEIDILKQLSHKHITLLVDIIVCSRLLHLELVETDAVSKHSPSHIHLIMEYCAGGDLSYYIKHRGRVEGLQYSPSPDAPVQFYPHPRSGGLAERCVRCFLRQLARALRFLRSRNLIHRDIKPQNLLLSPFTQNDLSRGHPIGIPILKVADFGFARILPNTMMAETLCGSPLYMAPEILRYEKYDAKADLWSVGAVLYEMSVGKPPFRAQNHIDLLRKIESSKGIKFPDEDESHPCHPLNPMNPKSPYYQPGLGNTRAHEKMEQVVASDLKALMRRLLVRHPVDRANFDEFFNSEALQNSKFTSIQGSSRSSAISDGEKKIHEPSPPIPMLPQEVILVAQRIAPPIPGVDPHKVTEQQSSELSARARSRLAVQERAKERAAQKIYLEEENKKQANVQSPNPPPTMTGSPRQLVKDFTPQPNDVVTIPIPETVLPLTSNKRDGRRQSDGKETDVGSTKPRSEIAYGGVETNRLVLETEASIIPGETEEDGLLRKEYVLVGDTKAVEFDKAVDELRTLSRRRPLEDKRSLTLPISVNRNSDERFKDSGSPRSSPIRTTFPPRPLSGIVTPSQPLTGALARALNIASKKLFGRRHATVSAQSSLQRKTILRERERLQGRESPGSGIIDDPVEEALLARLEDLAQKTQVLSSWADEMYGYVKSIPQKPLPDPKKFVQGEHEDPEMAQRRQNVEVEVEGSAVTCVALYMLLMGFSQKGIDALKRFKVDLEMRFPDEEIPLSESLEDGLSKAFMTILQRYVDHSILALLWFKNNFIKCNDRAALVKTWLPVEFEARDVSWLNQLIYDRALQLSRTGAQKELLEEATLEECERLYEESLWCLYALQDEIMKPDNPFVDNDKAVIGGWIARTKRRLDICTITIIIGINVHYCITKRLEEG
ncbi:hypothetical protein Clacol_008969 [Clathrus columnatus]|uniref:non-specific serine/threonine protein kinase n=1 Tax=Clathrus columnatus TaxID=1419009 RepID=A0AAV5AJ68_9AGAM|nr:hypothetical protein Clacol_008969 [Clathrus columnatus]